MPPSCGSRRITLHAASESRRLEKARRVCRAVAHPAACRAMDRINEFCRTLKIWKKVRTLDQPTRPTLKTHSCIHLLQQTPSVT